MKAIKNTRENIRYSIVLKKGYEVFYWALGVFLVAFIIGIIVLSVQTCRMVMEYIVCGALLIFFVGCAVGVYSILQKRVVVYKGGVAYFNGFVEKEYRLSDIQFSKTEVEAHDMYVGEHYSGSYDRVTTFYGKDGKKLFHFGLAYKGTDRLITDVINCRKSISNQSSSRKIK